MHAIQNFSTSPNGFAIRNLKSARLANMIRPTNRGLIPLTLMLSVAGCAHERPLPPKPVMVPVVPSAHLMAPTEAPPYLGATNGDLEMYVDQLRAALDRCNADKAAIMIETDQTARDLVSAPPTPR